MTFLKSTPLEIIAAVERWDRLQEPNVVDERLTKTRKIWRRLATEPAMEQIWPKMISTAAEPLLVAAKFVDVLDDALAEILLLPRLTTEKYGQKMNEIKERAALLAESLKEFDSLIEGRNPFSWSNLATENFRENVVHLLDDNFKKRFPLDILLDFGLPSAFSQVTLIAARAAEEARTQESRLKLGRKPDDPNYFRTFLIRKISDFFLVNHGERNHTLVAKICCVALDEYYIAPDLVKNLVRTSHK